MSTVLACGYTGKIARSTADGVAGSWVNSTTPNTSIMYSLANNGGDEWISCGAQVWRSTDDGVTFSQVAGLANFFSVCWSADLSLYCMVGSGGAIRTSPDGITWTSRTGASGYTSSQFDVYWDSVNSLFVCSGGKTRIQTSPDGITWTGRGEVLPSAPFVRLCDGARWHSGAGLSVAFIDGNTSGAPGPLIIYSGSSTYQAWNARYTLAGRYGTPQAIATNGTTIVVGDGHGQLHSSTDAINWSAVSGWPVSVSTAVACYQIAWTGTAFITVHLSGIMVRTTDLTTFSDFFWSHGVSHILGIEVKGAGGAGAPQTYPYETGAVNYTLTLTGAGDSLDDLTLPMSQARATFSNQRLSTFAATVPHTSYYSDVTARTNGELVVTASRVLSDGSTTDAVEMWRFPYGAVSRVDRPSDGQIELKAEDDVAYTTGNTVELEWFERTPERGPIKGRTDIDLYARPADTATFKSEDIESFTIGEVSYVLSPTDSYIEVSEFVDDDGTE